MVFNRLARVEESVFDAMAMEAEGSFDSQDKISIRIETYRIVIACQLDFYEKSKIAFDCGVGISMRLSRTHVILWDLHYKISKGYDPMNQTGSKGKIPQDFNPTQILRKSFESKEP